MERGVGVHEQAVDVARTRLDRARILDAAEAIADSEGVGRVTMRRIGAELGVDPTAIYRHFRNKEELLIELADRLFGIEPPVDPELPPREQLRAHMRYGLSRYRRHPDLAQLLAVQPDDTPNLQRIAESGISLLRQMGLPPAEAAAMFQVIENHVVGTGLYYALIEAAEDPRLGDPDAMRRAYALLPETTHPAVVEAPGHMFPDLDASYDLGTELILDAVERLAEALEAQSRTTGGGE
jgi:AcrR family transcriptional regulator